MEPVSDPVGQDRPQTAIHRPQSERSSTSAVYGFPLAANQYEALSAEFQSPGQREEGLVDPRTTRHLRQAARRAAEDRETLNAGNTSFTLHLETAAQKIFDNGTCVEPVAVGNSSQFIPYSFPASSSDILLQSGEPVH